MRASVSRPLLALGGLLALTLLGGCQEDDAVVADVPVLVVDSRDIDFGDKLVNSVTRLSAVFGNEGEGILTIEDITQGDLWNDAFQWESVSTPLDLEMGEELRLMILFQPMTAQVARAELLIHSNDPEVPVFTLELQGRGEN